MGSLASQAPPLVQAAISTILRARLELVVAGLDGSGKTAFVRSLRRAEPAEPGPTPGLVFHRTRRSGVLLQIWDLGGGARFRRGWARRAEACDALLFVLDGADSARWGEAREALHDLLAELGRRALPVLVLVSKVDLLAPHARGGDEATACKAAIDALVRARSSRLPVPPPPPPPPARASARLRARCRGSTSEHHAHGACLG